MKWKYKLINLYLYQRDFQVISPSFFHLPFTQRLTRHKGCRMSENVKNQSENVGISSERFRRFNIFCDHCFRISYFQPCVAYKVLLIKEKACIIESFVNVVDQRNELICTRIARGEARLIFCNKIVQFQKVIQIFEDNPFEYFCK